MLHIYITRHGETEWNTEGRLQGWSDSPLTEKGRRDAILLGNRLQDISFSAIYTGKLFLFCQAILNSLQLLQDLPI
jgi:broad specificity phosphatase PhoE